MILRLAMAVSDTPGAQAKAINMPMRRDLHGRLCTQRAGELAQRQPCWRMRQAIRWRTRRKRAGKAARSLDQAIHFLGRRERRHGCGKDRQQDMKHADHSGCIPLRHPAGVVNASARAPSLRAETLAALAQHAGRHALLTSEPNFRALDDEGPLSEAEGCVGGWPGPGLAVRFAFRASADAGGDRHLRMPAKPMAKPQAFVPAVAVAAHPERLALAGEAVARRLDASTLV